MSKWINYTHSQIPSNRIWKKRESAQNVGGVIFELSVIRNAVDVFFRAMNEKEGNLERSYSLQMKSTHIARLIDRIDYTDFHIGNVRKCYRMKGGIKTRA